MGKSLLARVPAPVKLGVPVATGLLAAACGSAVASQSHGSQAAGSQSSGSSAPATGTVIASHAGSGGTFLTDGGRAVYLWAADAMNKSNCSGACAGAWPPVMATGKVTASSGVKPSDLGTIARSGGGKQVTYNGHPLYFFAGDSGPGQTHGQGSDSFGAKWWLVAPSGAQITAADTAAASSNSAPMAPATSGGSWG
ncbi:MAG: COG4315 family predicted lipoprotein [Streptosporangiaceae bacterium]